MTSRYTGSSPFIVRPCTLSSPLRGESRGKTRAPCDCHSGWPHSVGMGLTLSLPAKAHMCRNKRVK
eukprot:7504389-Pyramimonas_sp.AAC.1